MRKRYADRQIDTQRERGSCEIESSVRKCTETHHPPNLPMLTHTYTHTLMLTSAFWQCVPVAQACGPLARRQSQRSCVPAGSDGHGAQWAPLLFDPLPTIHHLTRRGAGRELKLCCQLAMGKKKRRGDREKLGDTNTVETDEE